MKNKLSDLNDHLFMELERLGDEDLTGDALDGEIERAKAISGVAQNIIMNAKVVLEATRLTTEYGHSSVNMPAMLTEKPDGGEKGKNG